MVKKNNKFAVVTISFNQGLYIQHAIESVLGQNTNIDYCVVDAGSTDGSREIIKKYISCLKIVFEKDKGPSDGLNKGFKKVKGDYYYYLNADDILLPGALDVVEKILEDPNDPKILMGGVERVNKEGKRFGLPVLPWGIDLAHIKRDAYVCCQQGTFFTKSAWNKTKGFNINNTTCWDTELLVDAMKNRTSVVLSNHIFAQFRIYSESITGSQRLKRKYELDRNKFMINIPTPEVSSLISTFDHLFMVVNPLRRFIQLMVYLKRIFN